MDNLVQAFMLSSVSIRGFFCLEGPAAFKDPRILLKERCIQVVSLDEGNLLPELA